MLSAAVQDLQHQLDPEKILQKIYFCVSYHKYLGVLRMTKH